VSGLLYPTQTALLYPQQDAGSSPGLVWTLKEDENFWFLPGIEPQFLGPTTSNCLLNNREAHPRGLDMISTAVKNSISYNSTRVKNNDSNATLLLLFFFILVLVVVVVVMMVVVVVVVAAVEAVAFVKSKLCRTNGIHKLCRPVLVECNSDSMTLKRTNSMLLECIQLTSALNEMSQPNNNTPASYIGCPTFKSLTGHLTSFSGFSSVIHGKCHHRT
jgi:hypothetical protein